MKIIRFVVVIGAVAGVMLGVWLFGPVDTVPRVRAKGTCANNSLNITVYQKRLGFLPVSRVGILVKITDQEQNVIFDKIIFEDGWWYQDIGDMYKEVRCEGDTILIGPKFDHQDYYKIAQSDILKPR